MILRRWNYEKHIYEPYQASENAATYMEEIMQEIYKCSISVPK